MKPDFEKIADDTLIRTLISVEAVPPRHHGRAERDKARELIRAQLALAYQEGVCDGLRQSEAAIKAAFDKYQGRVEP